MMLCHRYMKNIMKRSYSYRSTILNYHSPKVAKAGLGWGNALQEVLLDSYLAYRAGRAYVFDNYTWSRDMDPPPYSEYNGKLIPSRVPLRAMITGPTAGGPYPDGDRAPRSVGVDYFREVCKHPQIISSEEINADLGREPTAKMVLNKWVETLNAIENRCVEVDRFSEQVFGYWTFGSAQRLLDIWPEYSKSPIIQNFRWSPLVQDAFDVNYRLFTSPSTLGSFFSPFRASKVKTDPYTPIQGLLVLHVRRGDYEDHCNHLANWSARYSGFNDFPEFVDKFTPPPGGGAGNTTAENRAIYIRHCFPSIEQIVKRIEEIRKSKAGKGLKNVYVMTNGARPWVADLKEALKKTGHWSKVATSRDLQLTPEQKYISQAIDMLIGHRAQVIIGNGFSSMTSNIVMLRMARQDLNPDSNRFW
ncbi:unnamed protein product [Somion occarium]|uniref:Fucosyltransferase n=1 Tax=Somion occarium TaxID=3059160 RepID=A0ABP1CJL8_9APHY